MMPAGAAAPPLWLRDGITISSACTKLCDTAEEVAQNSTKTDLCGADSKFQNAYIPCSRCIEKRSPGAVPSDLLSYLAYCNIDVDLVTSSLRMGDGSTSTIVNVKYAPTVAATVTSSVDTDFDSVDTSSDEPKSKAWIAGPVFGALVGLGIILGIVWFCWRRKHRNEEEDTGSEGARAISHKAKSEAARSEAARSEAARSVRSGRSRGGLSTKALSEQAKSDIMSDIDALSQHPPSTKHYSVKSSPPPSLHRRFSEIDSVNIHEMVGSPVLRSVAESTTGSAMDNEVSTIHTRYSEIDSRNINEMLGSPGVAYFKDIPPPLPPKDKFSVGRPQQQQHQHSEIDSNNIHEMAGSPVLPPVYEKEANEIPAFEMEQLQQLQQFESLDDDLDEMPVPRKKNKSRDNT
ncbi:unnamed protein product [Clonostachys rosea]|uniref:Uncharacterized protein n=1 Tax=Bionectria ochroleuca TaxID=29856 RepID=A0ABY6UF18_BIOOC|nr:unnamed protein product [Clonostachys rosea]